MLKTRIAGRWHWLITRYATSRMEVLTVCLGGDGEALAVFSRLKEAQTFLDRRLAASGEGWRVRQTSVGELVSVLYGPCSDTKRVVLDPVPDVVRKEPAVLISMDRSYFLRVLLGEGPSTPGAVSGQQTAEGGAVWPRRTTSPRTVTMG